MLHNKILPIIISIVIIVIGIGVIIVSKVNIKHFNKLVITYKDNVNEYSKLDIDNAYVIDNVTFWIKSIGLEEIVLNSSEYIDDVNEFEIKMNEKKTICVSENNCAYFELV